MGILNVTPDSFSDGGQFSQSASAVDRALRMEDEGASLIDIGGESTRPYSTPVDSDEELRRVVPVLEALRGRIGIPLSIDTSKARVAAAALDLGAEIVNDVTALTGDPEMLALVAARRPGVCLMHMRGTPQTMQDGPLYQDVVGEIIAYLMERLRHCEAAGVPAPHIAFDPGVGFGKTHAHNVALLRATRQFAALGQPLLIGHSRKGFIGKLLGDAQADRTFGTLGVSLAAALGGAQILRVHDVRPTVEGLRTFLPCLPSAQESPEHLFERLANGPNRSP
jgi:dihydropteroate synthase